MGDVLTAIREKSQAHQEESKAKRFRDRGGLWQPLSPSKNKLMAFLDSAEFQNITEEPSPAEHKAGPSQVLEATRTRSKQTGKATSSDIDAKPEENVRDVASARPKTKEKSKASLMAKLTERDRFIHSGPKIREPPSSKPGDLPSTIPSVESPIVSPKKVSGVKLRQKRNLAVVDNEEDRPTNVAGMSGLKLVQSQSATSHTDEHVTQPRRLKRATNTRSLEEIADEDVLSDYRPSPAKKRRTRAALNASKEPANVRNNKLSRTEDKVSTENEVTPIPRSVGDTSTITESSTTDLPIVDSSCRRRGSLEPPDANGIKSVKRRRTRNVQKTKETLKPMKQPSTDPSELDMILDHEVPKPRKRRTPASKSSTKPSSRTKSRRNCHEKPLMDSNDDTVQSGLGKKSGVRNGLQLSTIQEKEEIEHGSRVISKGTMRSTTLVPRVSGSEHMKPTLGMTKRKRKKVRVEQDDPDITVRLNQEVGQALGTSKKNTTRDAASPPPTLPDLHPPPLEKDDLLGSRKRKLKNKYRGSVNTPREDMGAVPPVSMSEKRKVSSKDNEVEPNEGRKMMQELNQPSSSRERHFEPDAMDSDFDEIDFLT